MKNANSAAWSLVGRLAFVAAGAVAGLSATAQDVALDTIPTSQIHSMRRAFVDLSTGEWSFDKVQSTSRVGDFGVFSSDSGVSSGLGFFLLDDPTRTSTSIGKFGTEMLAWADTEFDMSVDQIVIQYATNVPDSGAPGVDGYDCLIRVYDKESGYSDANSELVSTIRISGIPGSSFSSGYAGWIVTASLATTNSFELGDTDGVDYYGNPGLSSGTDEDGDGLADFGWSYQFEQNQAVKGGCGPVLTRAYGGPGAEGVTCATGIIPGTFTWYNSPPHAAPIFTFRIVGSPIPAGLSTGIEFRGPIPGCPALDLDHSGHFDLGDFFSFMNEFDIAGG